MIDLAKMSSASFSPDRVYRYVLWRIWDKDKPLICFVGLNPSTADEIKNDPTIRRCIGFAKQWGYGGILMGNIFAYRSTDPKELLYLTDPVGEGNDAALKIMNEAANKTVACWGNWGAYMNRGDKVLKILCGCENFGMTGKGQPKHPLYLSKSATTLKPVACFSGMVG